MYRNLKYALLFLLLASPAHAQVKFSQITSGGSIASTTDKLLAVRSGTTDVLVGVGGACVENLGSIVVDDGAGNLTLGAGTVTNGMLVHSSLTVAGHSISLGGSQAIACGDLSNGATGCSTVVGSLASLNTINNSNWSGTALAIGNGGTGQITASAAFNALSPMTTLGDTIYGGTSGTNTRLAGQTSSTKEYLSQTGTGSASAAPAWAQVAFGDLSGQATNAQLATQTANTVLGALTATTPSGQAVPSCSGATSALTWTSGTGFGCNTLAAGGVTSVSGDGTYITNSASTGAVTLTTAFGTAALKNTGTSGASVPLLNGNNVWSGTNLWTGTIPTLANGDVAVGGSATLGGLFTGQGSTDDITFQNKSGGTICTVATGTTTLNCTGLQVSGAAVLTGNQSITLSSDVTGSGTTAITTTIASNAVTNAKAAQGGANTMKGNWTSSTANEADNAMPSCADSGGNHLNYVSGTGITCGTSDLHAGTVTSVATTAPLAGGTITGSGTVSITGAAGQVLAGSTPAFTATPVLGTNASAAGALGLANGGALGTTITLQNLGGTTAYNFNLPATPGSAGQILTSQGGGTNNMTWATDNVGGGMFNYSDNGLTVTANTYFIPVGGGGIPQTTEAAVDVPSPSATTVTNLQVGISAAPGTGNSYTITLRDATTDTALTCQIAGASATSCSDLTHSVNVAQNDLIDWKFVSAGTIITTPTVTISANNGTSNVGVTSIATNNGLTGGTITTTGTIGLASVANNSVLCNNSGGSAVPTTANCTVTGTGAAMLAASPTASGTLSADALTTTGNNYLNGGYIESGTPFTANTGTSLALNIDNGPKQVITITGAVALTIATPAHFGSATFVLKEDATGHIYSISGCKWPGGTAITYSTAANALDVVSILYDGTNKYCMGGAAFS